MGRFSRKGHGEGAAHPVSAFWTWWSADGRTIDPHEATAAAEELTRRVSAIHPGLTWHFGPGESSQHRLTVSAGGIAPVRPAAERWLRAAPAPDATWEYRSSQQADPHAMSSSLAVGGHEVELAQTQFRVERVDEDLRVHVGVYHPAFGAMARDVRAQITFLVLDWVLGEDDVERWLGHVEPLTHLPAPASSAQDLRSAVESMARVRDTDAWAVARWSGKKGLPGVATFRRGLRWIDRPILDTHVVLVCRYTKRSDGMPLDASVLDRLAEIEAALLETLGPHGVLVGHETHAGARTFHAYTDGEDQNVLSALKALAARHGTSFVARTDAAWREVRHLTG